MRAHANCLENLPIYTAVVIALLVTGASSPQDPYQDPNARRPTPEQPTREPMRLRRAGELKTQMIVGTLLVALVVAGLVLYTLYKPAADQAASSPPPATTGQKSDPASKQNPPPPAK